MKPSVSLLLLALVYVAAVPAETDNQERVALVVGNSEYQYFESLANPVNDARDIGAALERLGYDTTIIENATFAAFDDALYEFGRTMADVADVGVFYYAGHAIEVDGTNYLIPVDARIRAIDEVRFRSVPLDQVLAKMETAANNTNVVILDACRDNPLPASVRSAATGRGLSITEAPAGTLIVYATAPGSVASDGVGKNGVFTGALLSHIETPGVESTEVLRRVRRDVMARTSNEQVPWENSSLTGPFYFAPGPGGELAVEPVPAPSQPVHRCLVQDTSAPTLLNGAVPIRGLIELADLGFRLRVDADGIFVSESDLDCVPAGSRWLNRGGLSDEVMDRFTQLSSWERYALGIRLWWRFATEVQPGSDYQTSFQASVDSPPFDVVIETGVASVPNWQYLIMERAIAALSHGESLRVAVLPREFTIDSAAFSAEDADRMRDAVSLLLHNKVEWSLGANVEIAGYSVTRQYLEEEVGSYGDRFPHGSLVRMCAGLRASIGIVWDLELITIGTNLLVGTLSVETYSVDTDEIVGTYRELINTANLE